jgi:hypothetical protein
VSEGGARDFAGLVKAVDGRARELISEIVAGLGEIDRPQAEMFARRFFAVYTILAELPAPEATYYRVGLVARMIEVLEASGPRALRVRALSDYYYSHSALLHHGGSDLALETLVDSATWRQIEGGLWHATVEGQTRVGPVHLNLLRLRGGHIRTVDCRGHEFVEFVERNGAAAAVSGGFFLYSEPDIAAPSERGDPVGLLVDGQIRPPVFRRAAVVQRASGYSIERIGMMGVRIRIGDHWVEVVGVNDPARVGQGAVVFNRAWGSQVDAPHVLEIVGDRARPGREIPMAGFCLSLTEPIPAGLGKVAYQLPDDEIRAAMAGGPMLLGHSPLDLELEEFVGTAPPVTFSQDETFDQNLLPRMGAGTTADGDLVFCAVDGRNFHRAPGMTLGMTARCLEAAGCVVGMNLDGGSSKRMVVQGEIVDLPSTEVLTGEEGDTPVRPVRSGILLFPG